MSVGPRYLVKWRESLTLRMHRDGGVSVELGEIPTGPGVYIFLRKHGKKFDALYVGKTKGLQGRIKNQLNNLHLMKEVRNSGNGSKMLMIGEFIPKPGQQMDPSLLRIEKALIRHFVSHNDSLLNVQGTKLKLATVRSERRDLKTFLPVSISVEFK